MKMLRDPATGALDTAASVKRARARLVDTAWRLRSADAQILRSEALVRRIRVQIEQRVERFGGEQAASSRPEE